MKNLISFLLILTVQLLASTGLARPTFGAEFTFTNPAIEKAQDGSYVNSVQSELHRDKMARETMATCDGCQLIREKNSYGVDVYKILYPDGFYFIIATDPAVVEVQTKPTTTQEIKRNKLRLQRDCFDAAKRAGMAPSRRGTGGGHIHIGFMSATGGDLKMLRNIIVDFANHPELANGILAYDHYNSPPISALPEQSQRAFARIIAAVDSGEIRDVVTFTNRIQNEVYTWTKANWNPPRKYQAFNVTRIADTAWHVDERTFEIRSIRPQQSADEYLMLTRMMEGRIEYLKSRKTPIPLRIPGPQNERQKFEAFAKYMSESGLNLDWFRQLFRLDRNSAAYQVQTRAPVLLCFKLFRY